ncbi:hypothetical protein DdX_17678 [Ditylenchus destructor]|uniref:Uncharacterized protein n=1 Tax=Ditylenchus destructor TaxID=166010 RepID=A0AAD4MLP6_9BILA|nr:hypothetical protein DdX_17678 [Ditylenchus destructor]
MRYNISNSNNQELHYVLKGKKFSCAYLEQLHHFRLSDRYALKNSFKVKKFPEDIVFIFGTSSSFYKSLRTALYSVQRTFGYAYWKIVVYDLGGLSNNATIMRELDGVCKLELRKFNFSRLPVNVRNLNSFSWKIYLIAEALLEFNTFIYFDTSVYFLENNYSDYFRLMEEGRLTGMQFTKNTNHGVRFATHSSFATNFISHRYCYHPSRLRERHLLLKKKSTSATIDNCAVGKEGRIPEDFRTNGAIQFDLEPNQQRGFLRYILNVCRGPHYVDFRISKEEYDKLLNAFL